jgi:hypothetical protein
MAARKRSNQRNGAVGVADHGGWAILVTAAADGTFVDRRRVVLVDEGLPSLPHHCHGQGRPVDEAVELVERVRRSANARAVAALDTLVAELPATLTITAIALRECPALPATVAERLQDYFAQNNADWVMYREALAQAAAARGWAIHWYDAKQVTSEAARILNRENITALLQDLRTTLGPPWQKDHRIAMAAAIVASASASTSSSPPPT